MWPFKRDFVRARSKNYGCGSEILSSNLIIIHQSLDTINTVHKSNDRATIAAQIRSQMVPIILDNVAPFVAEDVQYLDFSAICQTVTTEYMQFIIDNDGIHNVKFGVEAEMRLGTTQIYEYMKKLIRHEILTIHSSLT